MAEGFCAYALRAEKQERQYHRIDDDYVGIKLFYVFKLLYTGQAFLSLQCLTSLKAASQIAWPRIATTARQSNIAQKLHGNKFGGWLARIQSSCQMHDQS